MRSVAEMTPRGVKQVERVAALQHSHTPAAAGCAPGTARLALVLVESFEQEIGVAHLEVVRGEFALVLPGTRRRT